MRKFQNTFLSIRALYWYGFCFCLAILVGAIHMQFSAGLVPCPLCQLQRLMYLLIGFCCLIGGLCHLRKRKEALWLLSITALFIVLGGFIAGHQVWLQAHPSQAPPSCGAGIHYLFTVLPFLDAFKVMLMGTGECAAVDWRFWGLSLAGWSLVGFVVLMLGVAWQFRRVMLQR